MPVVQPFTVNALTVDGNITVNDDGSGQYGKIIAGGTNTAMLSLVATTGINGFTLQNGTPSIISWTAPNDGAMHRALIMGAVDVTSAETGGAVGLSFRLPDGSGGSGFGLLAGTATAGPHTFAFQFVPVQAGTTVTIQQTSALTAGAATLWAEVWAS